MGRHSVPLALKLRNRQRIICPEEGVSASDENLAHQPDSTHLCLVHIDHHPLTMTDSLQAHTSLDKTGPWILTQGVIRATLFVVSG